MQKLSTSSQQGQFRSRSNSKVGSFKIHMVVTVVLLVLLVLFYCLSGSLEKKEFNKGGSEAQLLLACMVGPLGVWMRWFLAKKLNGKGLGKNGFLKWIPFGTLMANVSAACVMAIFAILKKAVRLVIALRFPPNVFKESGPSQRFARNEFDNKRFLSY